MSLPEPVLRCRWAETKRYYRLMGAICSRMLEVNHGFPDVHGGGKAQGLVSFLLSCSNTRRSVSQRRTVSHTMACVTQMLKWVLYLTLTLLKECTTMTSEKKWECTFPNLQGVCMVAKKLKKFLALAEVQKSSLGSRQVVLPVREIYS